MESGLYTQSGVGVTVVLSISIFDVPDRTTGISSKGIGFSSGDNRFPGRSSLLSGFRVRLREARRPHTEARRWAEAAKRLSGWNERFAVRGARVRAAERPGYVCVWGGEKQSGPISGPSPHARSGLDDPFQPLSGPWAGRTRNGLG